MTANVPTAYEMAPIGVSGALEAVAAFGFCSDGCRAAFVGARPGCQWTQANEPDGAFADGHVCDQCGGPMAPPRYVVLNEHTLGYIYAEQPHLLQVLHGSVLKGSPNDWRRGNALIVQSDTIRDATPADFAAYFVQPPPNLRQTDEYKRYLESVHDPRD